VGLQGVSLAEWLCGRPAMWGPGGAAICKPAELVPGMPVGQNPSRAEI
jgi:hypothetical protein